jgi:chromosome partitioning protein
VGTTVLVVVSLKGGAGKTNTAAFVLHALDERGLRVIGIDADPMARLMRWSHIARWRLPVAPLPVGDLDRRLSGIVGDDYDVVVIDTPGEATSGIVEAALRCATHVLVCSAPTPGEYAELEPLAELMEKVTASGAEFEQGILLNRVVGSAASGAVYRSVMVMNGWRVLHSQVARIERFALAYGEPVKNARATGYGDAVAELLELEDR